MARRIITAREQVELAAFWNPELAAQTTLVKVAAKDAPVVMRYIRNNNGLRQHAGPGDFDQAVEPWGRYMSEDSAPDSALQPGWERGTVTFANPLRLTHDDGGWKKALADQYGATGKGLSQALLDAGHDGVITHDKYGTGEIVDIRPKDQRGHRVHAAEDYRGHHLAPGPDSGFPVHDMTGSDEMGGVPEDWYTHPQYYAAPGEVSSREMRQVHRLYNDIRGKPEAPVTIYRALPHGNGTFNTGDWVTPSLEYAQQHARSEGGDEDWPVIQTTVPAKHLWQNGDSYYEWGYHGPNVRQASVRTVN